MSAPPCGKCFEDASELSGRSIAQEVELRLEQSFRDDIIVGRIADLIQLVRSQRTADRPNKIEENHSSARMTTEDVVALLKSKPTITPDELFATGILPLSRNSLYEAIKRGDIESLAIGHKKAIVTAPLLRLLQLN